MPDEDVEDRAEQLRRKAKQLNQEADRLDALKEPSHQGMFAVVIYFLHNGYMNVAVRREKGWASTGHLGSNKSLSWATMLERFPSLAQGEYKVATQWSEWHHQEAK